MKLFHVVSTAILGTAMAIGVGFAISNQRIKQTKAVSNNDVFSRVSSASDLADGDEIIFVNQAGTYACGTTQNTNNRTPVAITTSSNSYTYNSSHNVQVFTVKKNGSDFGFHTGSGYIYSASSSNNYLKTNTTAASTAPSGTSAWTLSFSSSVATITNKTNTSYYLAFNGTTYFAQYKSGQSKPYIYKLQPSSTKTLSSIAVSGNMTKTSYSIDDNWSPAGLVVTATYDDTSTKIVTDAATWTYNPTKPNSTTITSVVATASYTEGGVTKNANSAAQAVTVTNKGTSANPYTVSEAYDIASSLAVGTNNGKVVYVTGTVSGTVTDKTYGANFDITDGSKTLLAYSISGAQGSNSGATGYIADGYTVVITGAIINHATSGYEVGYVNSTLTSSLVSATAPKTISSIAVKTAPTKTAYKSGEAFDATGLVITVTYSDSTTADIAYAGNEASFTFNPTTITVAGNVTITYREKTCTQAVTLISVTNVTGVASAPSTVYQNATISGSDVDLNVTYADSSVGTVKADSVTCDTSSLGEATATATYNAATGNKTATFTVTVKKAPSFDYISDTIVCSDLTATGTSYSSFSGVRKITDAVYAGNTNCQDNTMIGIRSGTSSGSDVHSGIVSTTSGGFINKVTVTDFDHAERQLDVYGSHTAYTNANELYASATQGTKVGTLNKTTQTITIEGDYEYVGVRSKDGLIKISSIAFEWKVEGPSDPLTANPTLSTGSEATVAVGKTIALTITTTPVDSDEKLIVTSADASFVTVTGTDRNYLITGVAETSAPVNVTVEGAKGVYRSTVAVTVEQAVKSYEDKVLTPDVLGLSANYADSDGTHVFESVDYVTTKVCKTNGLQFQKTNGELYNADSLYAANSIKAITLIMDASNNNEPTVYGGTAAQPTTEVSVSGTFKNTGVNTYLFSAGMAYFKIAASSSGAVNIKQIVIELEDSSSSVLETARTAAQSILDDLDGLCGTGGSGGVNQAQWDALSAHLNTILGSNADAKLLLKSATRLPISDLDQGSAVIENAMYHYDMCAQKFGLTPDSDISNVQPSPTTNFTISRSIATNAIVIITIVSVISITVVGFFFLLRKYRKHN